MQAGRLRHLVSLQAEERIPDGSGGASVRWAELRKVRAEITMPTGRVSPMAQQLTAFVSAEIRVRLSKDFVAGRRIISSRGTYMIEAVLVDNENSMLRLLCSSVPHP